MNPPFVSMVMPVHNEAAFIAQSLKGVLAQDYPSNRLEVLVADGLSTDGTREIIKSFASEHPNLLLIENPGKIVPTGLNAAIAQTRGEIIIRVDGHCRIAEDYVTQCVEHLKKGGVDGVGGSIETVGETPLAHTISVAMRSWFGVGGCPFRVIKNKTLEVDTIPFPAYTRDVTERAGKYDEELVRNQDDEYNYRLRKLGAKLLLAADVNSRYYCRSTISSLARQYFQYGFYKVRVLQKHPRQMRPRQFAPGLFAATLFFSLLLAPFSTAFQGGLAVLVAAYLAANLCASLILASRHGWGMFVSLPVVFATLHLSYGFGFLWGLLRFWRRWNSC